MSLWRGYPGLSESRTHVYPLIGEGDNWISMSCLTMKNVCFVSGKSIMTPSIFRHIVLYVTLKRTTGPSLDSRFRLFVFVIVTHR